jgi:hypothetical protein
MAGTITLNGITDAEFAMIAAEKAKKPGIGLTPQGLQPVAIQFPAKDGKPSGTVPGFNGVQLHWGSEQGLHVVYTIIHKLIHGHDKEPELR